MKFTIIVKHESGGWSIKTLTAYGAHDWAKHVPTKAEALLSYMSQGGLLSNIQNLGQYITELERIVYGVSI